jgi:predicted component of type VI protein secretion system
LHDVEDPKSTEDALGLLADANSYFQLAQEWEATAPAAATSYRDKAQQLQAAATAFLKLHDAPAVGAGGELSIPAEEIDHDWGLKETVDNPGRDTVGASRARLGLLVETGTLDLGIDAAATIDARNSLEKMLAHQMAAAHRMSMKFLRRAEQELQRQNDPDAVLEANRCTNAAARMMKAYQEGLLALGRMRTGGRQVVTVQHVQVSEGGQAIVAGAVNGSSRRPRAEGGSNG